MCTQVPLEVQHKLHAYEFVTMCEAEFATADADSNGALVVEELVDAMRNVKTKMEAPGPEVGRSVDFRSVVCSVVRPETAAVLDAVASWPVCVVCDAAIRSRAASSGWCRVKEAIRSRAAASLG